SLTDWWISIIGEIDCEKLADVQPLRPQQLSQAFEKWQWKSDQRQVDKGNRPRVLVVIEEGGASTKKWQWLKSAMDCGGVELLQFVDHKTAPSKLAFFIGSDPESHFAEEQTQKLRDMGVQKIIWIGDRDQKLFDDFLENGSNLFEFFSHFYETLGGDQ
ncbi:MAG: hypothetical protein KDD33_11395, partial [Bdellovibrionales bacterium]|nr:hypothetical protein [Bdellovibrionales bacterium]